MVSIILVNYNSKDMTDDCISSIVRQTHTVDYEIVVVDNASTDGSREYFSEDSRIRYIWNDKNLGFGGANNIGIESARGEYLFLLNTDTLLLNDALDYFMKAEKTFSGNAVLGAWLTDKNGNYTDSYSDFPSMKSELIKVLKIYTNRIPFIRSRFKVPSICPEQPTFQVDYVCGADMFLPRSVVERTGMFDTRYFMYYEESDWQLRMKEAGISRCLISGPKIFHLCGGSQTAETGQVTMDQEIRCYTSLFVYMRKHYSGLKVFGFKCLYFLLKSVTMLFNDFSFADKRRYFKFLIHA